MYSNYSYSRQLFVLSYNFLLFFPFDSKTRPLPYEICYHFHNQTSMVVSETLALNQPRPLTGTMQLTKYFGSPS
uniref:Uncharacterized protein n=1 Tax=Salix viminalis TaxID=40686 RepID=A0A6N2KEX9_SALVM